MLGSSTSSGRVIDCVLRPFINKYSQLITLLPLQIWTTQSNRKKIKPVHIIKNVGFQISILKCEMFFFLNILQIWSNYFITIHIRSRIALFLN